MKFDAKQINEMLSDRVRDVVCYLLPKGKKVGQQWQCGSVSGEPGKSLNVQLSGSKAGIWADFSNGDRGDMLTLWQKSQNMSFSVALEDACKFLGIQPPKIAGGGSYGNKEYKKPSKEGIRKPSERLYEYFLGRGIEERFVTALKLAIDDRGNIVFPFIRKDGELVGIKHLIPKAWSGEEKNKWWKDEGCEPCLWGWQSFGSDVSDVVLTEGEIDALSCYACGYPALSIPSGASDIDSWLEREFDNLQKFRIIRLCLDNDNAGKIATLKIAKRLGMHRIMFVELPEKDANDVLLKHGKEKLIECIENAISNDPETIKKPSDYFLELLEVTSKSFIDKGLLLPWGKCKQDFVFRPSELTVWTGWNGHGKTELLNYIAINSIHRGDKWMFFSPEMKPRYMLKRLMSQCYGRHIDYISDEEMAEALKFLDTGLYFYDSRNTEPIEKVLESFLYARNKFNCTHFVIDSLQKCGLPEGGDGELSAQKRFMDTLCNFKDVNDCHVHLVAHPRKGKDDTVAPNKMDIKGSGSITDLADSTIIVHRNRIKERMIANGYHPNGADIYDSIAKEPDVFMDVQKQRNGDWEGNVDLFYNVNARQYLSSAFEDPRNFVNKESLKNG